MRIHRVTTLSAELSEALARLLPQLSSSASMPTDKHLEQMLQNDNTHLFAAEHEGTIVGILTLVIVDIPTGRKAWIEDVVVDW